jgi:hypothetical protein
VEQRRRVGPPGRSSSPLSAPSNPGTPEANPWFGGSMPCSGHRPVHRCQARVWQDARGDRKASGSTGRTGQGGAGSRRRGRPADCVDGLYREGVGLPRRQPGHGVGRRGRRHEGNRRRRAASRALADVLANDGAPTSEPGAVQDRATWALPAAAVSPVGAPGKVTVPVPVPVPVPIPPVGTADAS